MGMMGGGLPVQPVVNMQPAMGAMPGTAAALMTGEFGTGQRRRKHVEALILVQS